MHLALPCFIARRKDRANTAIERDMMTALLETAQVDSRRGTVLERKLSAAECHAWLASHDEGRLSYLSGRGPRSVAVLYKLANDNVVMHLPDYHDAAHYAPGTNVRLDVEGVTDAGLDAVRVTGRAVLLGRARMSAPDGTEVDLDKDSSMVETSVVCLPISRVEGYETDPGGRE
jgi:hypothetical protein